MAPQSKRQIAVFSRISRGHKVRSLSTKAVAGDRRAANIRILISAITALFFFTALSAHAQPSAPSCDAGLMRRDEVGTGTLLLKTATPGCYLAAPRVSGDISVKISGPVARTKVTQRFENPADGW